jgi:hypothetical protein
MAVKAAKVAESRAQNCHDKRTDFMRASIRSSTKKPGFEPGLFGFAIDREA